MPQNFCSAAVIDLSFKEKTGESMTQKTALNGLGRIGRMVLRSAFDCLARDHLEPHQAIDLQIVLINDLEEPAVLAHFLEFDSVHGRWQADIVSDKSSITINGHRIPLSCHRDLSATDWVGQWG